jgi:hypothetical protein
MATKNRKPGRGGRPGRRWPLRRLARKYPFISAAAAFSGAGFIIFVFARLPDRIRDTAKS